MHVFVCSDYLAQQQYAHLSAAQHLEAQAMAMQPRRGFLRTLLAALGFRSRADFEAHRRQQALRYVAARHGQEASNFAKGRWGEDVLAAALNPLLDDRFVLLRNYTPPPPFNRGGDVDAVLVGPHGVTVFEVKTWTGRYLIQDHHWYCWQGRWKGWTRTYLNPADQVFANRDRITGLLQAEGLKNIPVIPIIALGPQAEISGMHNTGAYILHLRRSISTAEPVLGRFTSGSGLPRETYARVYRALVAHMSAAPR